MKNFRSRLFIFLFTFFFSIYLLIPTILKFTRGEVISKNPKPDAPWYHSFLPSETLKLGLDLKGGLHFVLGIDFNEVQREAISKMKFQVQELGEREKLTDFTLETTNDNKLALKTTGDEQWKKMDDIIVKNLSQYITLDKRNGNEATFRLTDMYEVQVRKQALEQSRETLRNRIDEFGIAEPDIKLQGEEKITVDFPGLTEPGRIKDIISRTAKLSFQVVRGGPDEPRGEVTLAQLQGWVDQFVKEKSIKLDALNPITKHIRDLNIWAESKVPKGTEILFQRKVNVNTKEAEYIPYLLNRDALVTGSDLQDAYMSFNPENNTPEVDFQLTPVGATKFEKATGENVGKLMAIVLDNNVHSAPVIKQKIGGGRARIEMGGTGKDMEQIQSDAKDTALVLRSGALPARLEFLEERVVGPSLGEDAIKSGTYSLIAGLALVFVFMSIYYRTSGILATGALALNGLYIVALMAAFEGTLTLPGLAGITLTLGMAVDANVLILERMREELRSGKMFSLALSEGYHHAFTAIIDTHLTTVIAGLVLLNFGYGPIRGFAVTMLIGLSASIYTAVFVTRLVYDYLVHHRNVQHISM